MTNDNFFPFVSRLQSLHTICFELINNNTIYSRWFAIQLQRAIINVKLTYFFLRSYNVKLQENLIYYYLMLTKVQIHGVKSLVNYSNLRILIQRIKQWFVDKNLLKKITGRNRSAKNLRHRNVSNVKIFS